MWMWMKICIKYSVGASKEIDIIAGCRSATLLNIFYFRKHLLKYLFLKRYSWIFFCKINRKTLAMASLFSRVACKLTKERTPLQVFSIAGVFCFLQVFKCVKPATLLKWRLWHRCFPVNFVKFPRTSFLQNTSRPLLLFIWSEVYWKS